MKALSLSRLCFVSALILGLLVAWNACLAQKADIAMKVGSACYSCGADECDWHSVNCEAQPQETCWQSDSCCRGPDTGDGTCSSLGAGHFQCKYTGCVWRQDEVCID